LRHFYPLKDDSSSVENMGRPGPKSKKLKVL
jgi:hypothetical protein